LCVTDSATPKAATKCVTWSITVTDSVANFIFVDPTSGSDEVGTGAVGSPKRTLTWVHANAVRGQIVYLRGGTHTLGSLATVRAGTDDMLVQWEWDDPRAVIFLGHPREIAVLDFGCGLPSCPPTPYFDMLGPNTYVDNLTVRNCRLKCFHVGDRRGRSTTFRRLTFQNLRFGIRGHNDAFIQYAGSGMGCDAYGEVVQDNSFENNSGTGGASNSTTKHYASCRLLVERNRVTNNNGGEGIALKQEVAQFTVRANHFSMNGSCGICGNWMNRADDTYGEISYNVCLGSEHEDREVSNFACLIVNQEGETVHRVDVYRNTFLGRIILEQATSRSGPFHFVRNVIQERSDHGAKPFACFFDAQASVSANRSRFVMTDNVCSGFGIVDANANLEGQALANYGPDSPTPRGHMIAAGTARAARGSGPAD
jgi:hypothetical protein